MAAERRCLISSPPAGEPFLFKLLNARSTEAAHYFAACNLLRIRTHLFPCHMGTLGCVQFGNDIR